MRRRIYDYFFFALLLSVLYGGLLLLSPFGGPLLASLVCALVFYPLYEALRRTFPKRSATFAALIVDLLVLVLFVTPIALLTWAVVQESSSLGPVMRQWSLTLNEWRTGDVMVNVPWLTPIRSALSRAIGLRPSQIQSHLIAQVSEVLEAISLWGAHTARKTILFLFDLMVMHFILFFLFRDGKIYYRYFYDFIPMKGVDKERLMTRIQDALIGVSRGWLLTCLVQGMLSTLGYLAAGIDGAVLLGVLTGSMGLIPIIGTFGIWVPVGLFLLAKGFYGKAIFILLWGALVVVGLIDSIIRPYLVGKRAQLPLFALFFALLGGVELWSAKGIILGPLLFAMASVLLKMYRERYLRIPERTSDAFAMSDNPAFLETSIRIK